MTGLGENGLMYQFMAAMVMALGGFAVAVVGYKFYTAISRGRWADGVRSFETWELVVLRSGRLMGVGVLCFQMYSGVVRASLTTGSPVLWLEKFIYSTIFMLWMVFLNHMFFQWWDNAQKWWDLDVAIGIKKDTSVKHGKSMQIVAWNSVLWVTLCWGMGSVGYELIRALFPGF